MHSDLCEAPTVSYEAKHYNSNHLEVQPNTTAKQTKCAESCGNEKINKHDTGSLTPYLKFI